MSTNSKEPLETDKIVGSGDPEGNRQERSNRCHGRAERNEE